MVPLVPWPAPGHQRLDASQSPLVECGGASDKRINHSSLLLSNLRRHWAEVSSVMVQQLAHSAASQGADGMEGAASAGQGGRQPKNLHRKLMTMFGTPHGAPALT